MYYGTSHRSADCASCARRRSFAWTLFWRLDEVDSVFTVDCSRSSANTVTRWTPKPGPVLDSSGAVHRRLCCFDSDYSCNNNDLLRLQRAVARFPILRVRFQSSGAWRIQELSRLPTPSGTNNNQRAACYRLRRSANDSRYRYYRFGVPARLCPNGLYFLFPRLQDFLAREKS